MLFRRSLGIVIKYASSNYQWLSCAKYSTARDPKYNTNLTVRGVALDRYIESLENEYRNMSSSKGQNSDRYVQLQYTTKILAERQLLIDSIHNLKELLSAEDSEMRSLAEEEKTQLERNLREVDEKLIESLVPVDPDDVHNTLVFEVQAGVGGQEAMLFAKELFEMYSKFAEYKGWKLEIADYLTSDLGGLRHAVAIIEGKQSYRYLKHEAGIHRVQRTPATEKSGRIHTSTASVIAMPQPSEVEVTIDPKDLKIETKRSSGAGGQHVNKTESAVRITHLPTGVSVECQVDRSQIRNRKMAMARLLAILYEREQEAQRARIESTKKGQVKSMNRNEKIRTYNYNQNRITDHRYGIHVHNLEAFLEGGEALEELIVEIDKQWKWDNLLNMINSNK